MTWKEDAVSREAPASLEAPFTADARHVSLLESPGSQSLSLENLV